MELFETGDPTGEYVGDFTAGAAVTYYYKCCRKKTANRLDFKLWPGIMRVERMIPRVTPTDWRYGNGATRGTIAILFDVDTGIVRPHNSSHSQVIR